MPRSGSRLASPIHSDSGIGPLFVRIRSFFFLARI